MLLSAVSFLVVAQSSSEVPEGLMNNPVLKRIYNKINTHTHTLYTKVVQTFTVNCYHAEFYVDAWYLL